MDELIEASKRVHGGHILFGTPSAGLQLVTRLMLARGRWFQAAPVLGSWRSRCIRRTSSAPVAGGTRSSEQAMKANDEHVRLRKENQDDQAPIDQE